MNNAAIRKKYPQLTRRIEDVEYPIVVVDWLDHSSCRGWQNIDETAPTPIMVHSVGFLTNEDDLCIQLFGGITHHNDGEREITILKGDIVRKKRIRLR